jgi:excisionase family DNA binding protein|nr:MAG TPA: helix-turn-helix domain protein [Caudoviricetes sp.]
MVMQLDTKMFLTVDEVATLMDVSKPTVQSWIADHSLKAFRKDRTVRVSRKALETFINENPW